MTRIYARLSAQGTACDETALCGACRNEETEDKFCGPAWPGMADPPVSDYRDCTFNDALSCQRCGVKV